MDDFSIAVIVGNIVMCTAFIALIVFDKPRKPGPVEPLKPAGKKSA